MDPQNDVKPNTTKHSKTQTTAWRLALPGVGVDRCMPFSFCDEIKILVSVCVIDWDSLLFVVSLKFLLNLTD